MCIARSYEIFLFASGEGNDEFERDPDVYYSVNANWNRVRGQRTCRIHCLPRADCGKLGKMAEKFCKSIADPNSTRQQVYLITSSYFAKLLKTHINR